MHEDKKHFEFLVLEGAQAGLSWLTVLKKRDAYRKLFLGFDFNKVAKFGEPDVRRLVKDAGIIRNRLKIRSAIHNARCFIKVRKEFDSFDKYLWRFTGNKPVLNRVRSSKQIPPHTPLSDAVSQDLKKRGFCFVGSTIMYAYLQAVGVVDDHENECFRKK